MAIIFAKEDDLEEIIRAILKYYLTFGQSGAHRVAAFGQHLSNSLRWKKVMSKL